MWNVCKRANEEMPVAGWMDGRPSFNSVGQKQLSDDGKEYKLAKGDMEKMKESKRGN